MHPTTDITPYSDEDVARVVDTLLHNRDLIDAIGPIVWACGIGYSVSCCETAFRRNYGKVLEA